MRIRFLSIVLLMGLMIGVLPATSGCEAVASYLLYNWIDHQFNGNNTNKDAPVIQKISTSVKDVHIGDTVTLDVTASDNKDSADALQYLWFASAGVLQSPTKSSTVWDAPNTVGVVTISVMVEDTDGNQDSQTVQIQVQI